MRETLSEVEEFAYKCDNPSNYNLFFSKAIRNSKFIQKIIEDFSRKADIIVLKLEKDYYRCIDKVAKYNDNPCGYLEVDNRQRIEKASIIDIALEYCVRDNRNIRNKGTWYLKILTQFLQLASLTAIFRIVLKLLCTTHFILLKTLGRRTRMSRFDWVKEGQLWR